MLLLRLLTRHRRRAAALLLAGLLAAVALPHGQRFVLQPSAPEMPVADFGAAMGYEPEPAPGRPDVLLRPDGGCSTPTGGTVFGFDDACREHDLAYDVLRYRSTLGEGVDVLARWAADATFGVRLGERCVARGGLDAGTCLATATLYSAAVTLNSVRQLYGPPVEESVLSVVASTVALLAVLTLLLAPATAARGFRRFLRHAEADLPRPPSGSGWSGSDGSLVAWGDLGREGRRLLTRSPAAPGALRVFVGLESARRLDARVRLAVAEAERAGAFSRGTVCVAVPTGSGWVNPVAVEGLERATGGDAATIAVQYAAAPSWLSVLAHPGAHCRAAEALLTAVHERWLTLDPAARPRLVVLGESLGANALATATRRLPHVTASLDGGLLAGGIGSAHWEPLGRVGLVRHDDDPVVRLSLRPLLGAAGRREGAWAAEPWWLSARTLARVVRALPGAGSAPEGSGHHYGRELGAAWRTSLAPAGRSRSAHALSSVGAG